MSMQSIREFVRFFSVAFVITLAFCTASPTAAAESRVVIREIHSNKFDHNKIGTNPVRKLAIYLPDGYDASQARYPVLYYLQGPMDSFDEKFYANTARKLLDQAIASGRAHSFILAAVDMATPLGCTWYVNSPVTGNWEDFMIQDVVPYVDSNFRTLSTRDSRGIFGDFMGAYGAIRFGMTHPEIFGSVYGMHPVGTGSGLLTMYSRPNWDLLANAKTLEDAKSDGFSRIFTTIFQAHLPDVEKGPLFIDLQAHNEGGHLVIDSKVTARLRDNFFLESLVPKYADNLKSLRGFKFDWARSDGNQDHVYSNQALTHKLNEFGIAHEAEEYNGLWQPPNWEVGGRVWTDVLPFFEQHLVFAQQGSH